MNIETRTEAAQFNSWEHLFKIFGTVYDYVYFLFVSKSLSWGRKISYPHHWFANLQKLKPANTGTILLLPFLPICSIFKTIDNTMMKNLSSQPSRGWDRAKWLECLTTNAKATTVPIFERLWNPGIDSKEWIPPGLCSLAGRYDNSIPTRFLALINCLQIPAMESIPASSSDTVESKGRHMTKRCMFSTKQIQFGSDRMQCQRNRQKVSPHNSKFFPIFTFSF